MLKKGEKELLQKNAQKKRGNKHPTKKTCTTKENEVVKKRLNAQIRTVCDLLMMPNIQKEIKKNLSNPSWPEKMKIMQLVLS